MPETSVAAPARFGKALVWVGLSYGFAMVGQLAVNGLAARIVGASEYAAFAAIVATTVLVSQLGLFGAQTAALRDGSVMRAEMTAELRREHVASIRTVTRLVLPVLGVVTGVVLAVLDGSGRTSVLLAAGVAVTIVMGGLQRLYANYLRGFGEVRLSSLLEGRSGGAVMLSSQAVALLVLFLVRPDSSLAVIVAVMAVATVPGALVARPRVLRRFAGPSAHEPWHPIRDLRVLMRRARGFAALQAGVFLDTNVELYVALAALSATDSAAFAAAQRLALLIIVPSALLQMVISPVIVRHRDEPARLEGLVRTAATLGTALSLVVVLPLVLAGGTVARLLFGPGFEDARWVLVVLSAGYLVRVAAGLATVCLSMTGLEPLAARVYWVGIAVRVIAGSVVAATVGLMGFAICGAVVTVAVFWTIALIARRRLGVRTMPTLRPRLRTLLRVSG